MTSLSILHGVNGFAYVIIHKKVKLPKSGQHWQILKSIFHKKDRNSIRDFQKLNTCRIRQIPLKLTFAIGNTTVTTAMTSVSLKVFSSQIFRMYFATFDCFSYIQPDFLKVSYVFSNNLILLGRILLMTLTNMIFFLHSECIFNCNSVDIFIFQ